MTTSEKHDFLVIGKSFQGEIEKKKLNGIRVTGEAENYRITYDDIAEGYSKFPYDRSDLNTPGPLNGSEFSTVDGNDANDCARMFGPWWHSGCHNDAMNGKYPVNGEMIENFANGIIWKGWKTYHKSLKESTLMIRPQAFRN